MNRQKRGLIVELLKDIISLNNQDLTLKLKDLLLETHQTLKNATHRENKHILALLAALGVTKITESPEEEQTTFENEDITEKRTEKTIVFPAISPKKPQEGLEDLISEPDQQLFIEKYGLGVKSKGNSKQKVIFLSFILVIY